MSYAVVTFTNSSDHPDENDYCTSEIPMSWLCNNNTKCWWPTSNKNVGSLISKGAPPNTEKWSVEDVVVEQTGVSLEKGRKIANDLDYASSDDASKGRGKRKIINPRKSTSDEECNTNISSKNWRKLTNIALPPQLPGSKVDNYVLPISPMIAEEAGVSGDQENEIQCMPIILASENQIQSMPIILSDEQNLFLENNEVRGSDAHVEEQFIDLDLSFQHSQSTMSRTQNVIEDPNTISDYIGSSNANIGEHLTKITRMFVSINMALKSIDQRLGRLETGPEGAVCDNEGLELIKGSLPLNDIEAITAFDNLLSNKEVSKQFKKYVTGIGGSCGKDNISRILKSVFTNACAVNCSWMGRKNNFAMHKLRCIAIVKDVVCSSFSTKENEFEQMCSEWLRFAKQRLNREK
uniref:DUF4806 domain-containing protein n=4 Tax=Photinus pyralis TaxID=7054 RepID=A0A1Y1M2B3_PHOPY